MIAKTNIDITWDGISTRELSPEILAILQSSGVIRAIDIDQTNKNPEKFISFCGIVQHTSGILVFLPKSHPKPSVKDRKSTAKSILSCINKYFGGKQSDLKANGDEGLVGSPERLSLYKDIVEDYRKNGLYRAQEKVRKRINSGKIDWKSTIKRVLPIFSKNGALVYPSFITNNYRQSSTNLIARIHAAIVNEIDENLGWWFADNDIERAAPELRGSLLPSEDRTKLVAALCAELAVTFTDRQIRLLQNLIAYLNDKQSFTVLGNNAIGVRRFEYIWEHMIEHAIGPSSQSLKRSLPSPVYIDSLSKVTLISGKSGRIDTLIHEGNCVAIVDAKYYQMSGPTLAPGWPDLVKQYFYERLVKSACAQATIGNYFIAPRSNSNNSPLTATMGRATSGDKVELAAIFPPIGLIYQCPREMIIGFNTGLRNGLLRDRIFELTALQRSKSYEERVMLLQSELRKWYGPNVEDAIQR